MKKLLIVSLAVLGCWLVIDARREHSPPALRGHLRTEVASRHATYSPTRERAPLFSPALPGDAAGSYQRARDSYAALAEDLDAGEARRYFEDLGRSMPMTLVAQLRDGPAHAIADLIVAGANQRSVRLQPSLEGGVERYRVGRLALLVAIADLRAGDELAAARRALAVQRYANDLSRQSLLGAILATWLAHSGAEVISAIVESGRLGRAEARLVATGLDRLRRDGAPVIDGLLAECHLIDTLLLARPVDQTLFTGPKRIWAAATGQDGDDRLGRYAEVNGRFQATVAEADGPADVIAACDSVIGRGDVFCEEVSKTLALRGEADIALREAQAVAIETAASSR